MRTTDGSGRHNRLPHIRARIASEKAVSMVVFSRACAFVIRGRYSFPRIVISICCLRTQIMEPILPKLLKFEEERESSGSSRRHRRVSQSHPAMIWRLCTARGLRSFIILSNVILYSFSLHSI